MIEITGSGTLTTHPKSVTGGGAFTHKASDGTVIGSGTPEDIAEPQAPPDLGELVGMAAGRQECAVQGAVGAPDDPLKPDTRRPERLREAHFDGPTAPAATQHEVSHCLHPSLPGDRAPWRRLVGRITGGVPNTL